MKTEKTTRWQVVLSSYTAAVKGSRKKEVERRRE
jgi:hypothetical protein